jgi:hypothetical protein
MAIFNQRNQTVANQHINVGGNVVIGGVDSVTINGKTYKGNNISIGRGNQVYIDGKLQTDSEITEKEIHIVIIGVKSPVSLL